MLRIRLLGDLVLEDDGTTLPPPESARARTLLAWLAVHRGLHSRSRVAGLLRPDVAEESARKSVRDAVWAVRRALGPGREEAIVGDREQIGLAPDVRTDLDDFRARVRAGRLEDAASLAGGELLPGMGEDWVLAARDRVSAEIAEVLGRLAEEAERRGDLSAAVRWSRELAALDPLAEEPARALMRRLAAAGERGRAITAYEDLAARLRRDLRAAPSPETRALVDDIRGGAETVPAVGSPSAPVPDRVATVPPAPSVRPTEIRYAQADGASIAYAVVGDGPLDVVFVPGFVSHLEVFWEEPAAARFLARLASFARVVLWDKREQGLSDRTGVAPTLEQSGEDLLAVMDAAHVDRAAIMGVSEGGPMSALFAATHPDRVRALVLYGTHARILAGDGYPEGLPAAVVARTIEELAEGWGGAPCLDLFAPSCAEDPAFVGWWSRLLRSATSPGSVRSVMAINEEIDVRDILPAVRVPALVLHAASERLVPARLGRALAGGLPDARFIGLDIEDHIPFPAAGDLLADEIEEFLTGRRPAEEPERVLATVVFADIAGSTERAAALGDRRWRALLEAYRRLVADECARFRGRQVSTAGDGTLLAFEGPARGVRAALALVEAAAELDVPVRVGVHTGECEIVDGDDLAGIAVHIGARIGALAAPGEVLASSTVKDLVVGSDLRFDDRGEHDLRGIPGRWRVFAAAPSRRPAPPALPTR